MRRAGVLSPVFSLPGAYGIGDFGKCAYDFVDLLSENGLRIWQVLPLNPIGYGNSPYQPYSSEAGDTVYIDLQQLYEEGLLQSLPEPLLSEKGAVCKVDYEAVRALKQPYFEEAYRNFKKDAAYEDFARQEWVYLYAVFKSLKDKNHSLPWNEWPKEEQDWIKDRKADLSDLSDAIGLEMFLQYIFYRQWQKIRQYAAERGVRIMGDIPFYVGQDSLDVWGSQEEFLLDPDGYPGFVAGVPPDYFAAEGQRWGNPIYDWAHMEKNGFAFWKNRLLYTAKLYDMIRIDHFRAFDTYWKIPRECPTAMVGEWIEAPGYKLFDKMIPLLHGTEIIAEDLGEMRPEVYALRDHYGFPGMNVLQFTLLDPSFKTRRNMFVYTGTHDNDTILGWYRAQEPEDQRKVQIILLGLEEEEEAGLLTESAELIPEDRIPRAFIRHALKSDMDTCIIPWQDLLALGSEGRINTPGIVNDENWKSRMTGSSRLAAAMKKYGALAKACGRA